MLYDKITELCSALETDAPAPDADGAYHFSFVGGVDLTCSEHNVGLMLEAPLADVSDDEHEQLERCKKLLKTSLGLIQKSKLTVSLDMEAKKFVAFRRYVEDSHQTESFSDAVEHFLNDVEHFKTVI